MLTPGVVSGIYIWREPLEQYRAETGGVPPPAAVPEAPRARKAEAGDKGVLAAPASSAAEAKAPAEKAAPPAASAR